jgi:hypothetical protein
MSCHFRLQLFTAVLPIFFVYLSWNVHEIKNIVRRSSYVYSPGDDVSLFEIRKRNLLFKCSDDNSHSGTACRHKVMLRVDARSINFCAMRYNAP